MNAPLFWARIGPHLIGKVDPKEVVRTSGDSIALDRYKLGRVQGDLWARVAEVTS